MASGENSNSQGRKRTGKTGGRIYSNPFLNFMTDFRREMQGQNISVTRMSQLAGQRWREMTPEERLPYIEMAQQARGQRTGKKLPAAKRNKKDKVFEQEMKRVRKFKEPRSGSRQSSTRRGRPENRRPGGNISSRTPSSLDSSVSG